MIAPRWITVQRFAAHTEDMTDDQVYRLIRENKFPFRFIRLGRLIRIDAVDAGLFEGPQENEAQTQGESLTATA